MRPKTNRTPGRRPTALLASVALATILPAIPLRAQSGVPADALPLQTGNTWTYDGTIWWVPNNSRRVLEERVTLEVSVVELVEWGRMRGAVLRGYPEDLITSVTDRFDGEFTLLQVGSRVHLLRGDTAEEAIRRLRQRDETVVDLVRGSEVILDLPLAPGKTFCPDRADRADPRRCWFVKDEDPVSVLPVHGVPTTRSRERFVLDLRSRGEHEVRGFVPGVGFTSFGIGQAGDPAALELELVAVDLAPPGGIFLKTLDLAGEAAVQMAVAARPSAIPAAASVAPSEDDPQEVKAGQVQPPDVSKPTPPPDADGDGVPDDLDRCGASAADETVDRHGCPLPPPERITERRERPQALAIRVVLEEIPVPDSTEPACLDEREWFLSGEPIEFDGRPFDPIGTPEPISLDNLVPVGEYDGIPLYVGRYASQPHMDVWLPVCGAANTFRLYADLRSRG